MVNSMPAIRYSTGSLDFKTAKSWEHYFLHKVELVAKPGAPRTFANCVGFICNAGARFLPEPKLGRIIGIAVTNDCGGEDSNWVLVPEGEYVYCIVVVAGGRRQEYECYVLVDDLGWPILSGKKRETTTSCGPEAITEGIHLPSNIDIYSFIYLCHSIALFPSM